MTVFASRILLRNVGVTNVEARPQSIYILSIARTESEKFENHKGSTILLLDPTLLLNPASVQLLRCATLILILKYASRCSASNLLLLESLI